MHKISWFDPTTFSRHKILSSFLLGEVLNPKQSAYHNGNDFPTAAHCHRRLVKSETAARKT